MSGRAQGGWDAAILRELAALLDAGVGIHEALMSLGRRHRAIAAAIPDLTAGLRAGFPTGDTLYAAGAISREAAFELNIAAESGRLDAALGELARRQEGLQRRSQRLRGRLQFSRLAGCIALLAGGALGFARGEAAPLLLSRLLLDLLLILIFIALLVRGVRLSRSTWLTLAWRLGIVGRVRRLGRLCDHYFGRILHCQLAAGLAPSQALENAVGALNAHSFAEACRQAAASVQDGASLCDALEAAGLLHDAELRQVLLAGEHAGRLAESLGQYLELQQARIELELDALLDWLPRFAYLVTLAIALSMLRAGG